MKTLAGLIILLTWGCTSGIQRRKISNDQEKINARPLLEKLHGIWATYSSKGTIPQPLLKILDSIGGRPFKIANPTEPFNSTDVVTNEDAPWRQLQFLGNAGHTWLLTYKHGGFGFHYHFVTCDIKNGQIESMESGTAMMSLATVDEVQSAFKDDRTSLSTNDGCKL